MMQRLGRIVLMLVLFAPTVTLGDGSSRPDRSPAERGDVENSRVDDRNTTWVTTLDLLGGAEPAASSESEASPFLPPGHGGTPPGQGGTPPGQTNPPGKGGTPPGQGGTAPGQGGGPPPGRRGN